MEEVALGVTAVLFRGRKRRCQWHRRRRGHSVQIGVIVVPISIGSGGSAAEIAFRGRGRRSISCWDRHTGCTWRRCRRRVVCLADIVAVAVPRFHRPRRVLAARSLEKRQSRHCGGGQRRRRRKRKEKDAKMLFSKATVSRLLSFPRLPPDICHSSLSAARGRCSSDDVSGSAGFHHRLSSGRLRHPSTRKRSQMGERRRKKNDKLEIRSQEQRQDVSAVESRLFRQDVVIGG